MYCSNSNGIAIKCCYFFVKKQISPKEVKNLFLESEAFEGVTDVQKTVIGVDKFKGVYLISFSCEEFARNCVEVDVELNGNLLDKILLRDYKFEKFFLRQIRKTRSFKLNQDYLMDNLKDVKEDAKLENCVVIQVDAEEEDVMEQHNCSNCSSKMCSCIRRKNVLLTKKNLVMMIPKTRQNLFTIALPKIHMDITKRRLHCH